MAVTAPDRSLSQRLEALQHANRIRSTRAVLKRDLKAGRRQVSDVIAASPEWLESARVYDLLLAVPRLGRVKVAVILKDCRISPAKTVSGLSARQRADLLAVLRGRAA